MQKMNLNKTLTMMIFGFFILGTCLGFTTSVKSEMVKTTILDEGFEGEWTNNLPSSKWISNTGWLDSHYGNEHNGSHWAYSWTAGDNLTTKSITFGNDTELSFWYAAEKASTPQTLEVYIDDNILIWSEENFENEDYIEAIINLSDYVGDHKINFVGMSTSFDYGQLLDDVKINSFFDEDDIPVGDDDDDSSGLSGDDDDDDDDSAPPFIPDADNTKPVADLSKGEPYQGFTNGSIMFDGTNSFDSDDGDEIVKWIWYFGDNTDESGGSTAEHIYENEGTYTVTLQVIDSNGAVDNDTTTVSVEIGNNPPSKPLFIESESFGVTEKILILKNQSRYASFSVSSVDIEGEPVSFTIDWGDESDLEYIDEIESGASVNVSHIWDAVGRYDISIIATDASGAVSEETQIVLFMNIGVESIDGELTGYLFSETAEGEFSYFYHPDLDLETEIEKDENNQYLIDSDGDDDWDYIYNMTTGLMAYQSDKDPIGTDTSNGSETPGFGIILLSISICIFVIIQRKIK